MRTEVNEVWIDVCPAPIDGLLDHQLVCLIGRELKAGPMARASDVELDWSDIFLTAPRGLEAPDESRSCGPRSILRRLCALGARMEAIQKYGTMIKSPSGYPIQSPYKRHRIDLAHHAAVAAEDHAAADQARRRVDPRLAVEL